MNLLYDNFEIHLVGEFNDNGELHCQQLDHYEGEQLQILKEEANAIFWTVYGHRAKSQTFSGCVDAIKDFEKENEAIELCNFLNELLDKSGYRHPSFK